MKEEKMGCLKVIFSGPRKQEVFSRKSGVLLVLVLISTLLSLIIVSAANETLTASEKAYACLEGKVKGKCSSLTFEEQVFSLLALAYKSDIASQCKSSIKSKSSSNECWPAGDCKIKDTAQAIIALKFAKEDTSKAEKWLSNHNISSSDLEWYLEIDSSVATTCTIKHDSVSTTISIGEDKKITSLSDSCLSLAFDNYWMKISPSCLTKQFDVSCNQDFISTVLYKKANSNVWHVPFEVKSASKGAKTSHQIDAICFSASSSCNYEDNLWAAYALSKKQVLPYLIAFADDNERYFPYSFLYILTNQDDNLKKILDSQKSNGYWEFNTRYYDTALALLALSDSEAETRAKTWIEAQQASDGCYNSIRDTAFLLWAGWQKQAVGGVTPSSSNTDCVRDGKGYCMTLGECTDAGGDVSVLRDYDCSGLLKCCDKPKKQETCLDKKGAVCPSGKVCSIATITTSDSSECCTGDCNDEQPECESQGNTCRARCLSDEQESTLSCEKNDVCCAPKPPSSGSYWWIWLLIILIILVVLGIIFRDRIRMQIFKLRGGKTDSVEKTRPAFPPYSPPQRGMSMPRPMMPQRPMPPARSPYPAPKSSGKTDSELDDTLKKLREMSK